jgi:hypothetical protein
MTRQLVATFYPSYDDESNVNVYYIETEQDAYYEVIQCERVYRTVTLDGAIERATRLTN